MADINYIEINKQSWNKKTEVHLASDFYDLDGFLKGNTSLNDIELKLLGNVKDKSILHLQCHFGQDTISLARLGANATGVDLSDNAINKAQELAQKCSVNTNFICCNIYDLPKHLNQQFDIVYTSYGTIGWLPDLDKWANLVSRFLKPNGKFVFVEFHPVVWMYDNNFTKVEYSYFNVAPIIETETGTYADREAPIIDKTITWNHPTSEVLNSLINNGFEINSFDEYNYSPYNCFRGAVKVGEKKYQVAAFNDKIPLVFSLVATKKATA